MLAGLYDKAAACQAAQDPASCRPAPAPFAQQDAASLPEVVNDAAIVVDPSDVEQIADAMRLILTQPALVATHSARDDRGRRRSADGSRQFSGGAGDFPSRKDGGLVAVLID